MPMGKRGAPDGSQRTWDSAEGPAGLSRRTRPQQQQQQQQQQHHHHHHHHHQNQHQQDEAPEVLVSLIAGDEETGGCCEAYEAQKGRGFGLRRFLPHRLLLKKPCHRNVSLMLYFRVLNAISYAARSASIFDAYLHMQFGGNKAIGAMASMTGLITVIVAPLSGWAADALKSRRCVGLRAAAAWGVFCVCVNFAAIGLDSFNLLLATNLMWKGWYECVTVLTESLFNDAIPPGQRSRMFVLRRILTTLANGLGPLLSLCVFLLCGNAWKVEILHKVLRIGVFLSIPQLLVLLFWKEISEQEALQIRMQGKQSQTETAEETAKETAKETALTSHPDIKFLFLRTRHVPWLMFVSHCITFCGAGMTVKYFPLFFKSEYAFQPIHSCLLSTAYTLSIAALTYVIQVVATYMGPTEASFLFTSIGVAGIFLLSQVYFLPSVIIIYLMRGAFQNASTPIDRSVCLDLIPPRLVGRWAALQSLATLMWSVSALFGGLLADYTNYRQIFTFTGRIYILAQLVYLPCLWLLPHRKRLAKQKLQLANNMPPLLKPELSPTTAG